MTVITAELEIRLLAMNLGRAERALEELSKREHDRRKELGEALLDLQRRVAALEDGGAS